MITIVYSTRSANPGFQKEISNTIGVKNYQVLEYINNGEYSLTEVYNRGLKEAENDIVVFCHDDIYFDKKNWGKKLLNNFTQNTEFGIIGIAGTTSIYDNGCWWTDGNQQGLSPKMVGIVNHSHEGKKWTNKYSGNFQDRIIETVMTDGLLFAADKTKIKKHFNEDFKGFHFYDVDFTFSNHLSGVKVGVCFNVRVTHRSIGKTNEEWDKNRDQFAQIYKKHLPYNIKPKMVYRDRESKFKKQPNIRIIITANDKITPVKKIIEDIKLFGFDNLKFNVLVNEKYVDTYESDSYFEGLVTTTYYDVVNKNMFSLKLFDDFFDESDELILFIDGSVEIKNNILSNFVRQYLKNKKTFGVIYPRVVNEDDEIVSNGVQVLMTKENKIFFNFKSNGSYYGYEDMVMEEPLGNLGVCFMTTYNNLKLVDFFRLNFDKVFYETDYSLKCVKNRKSVFVDHNSVVSIDKEYYGDTLLLTEDFKAFVENLNEDKRNMKYIKLVG
jgi:hypothetical protein